MLTDHGPGRGRGGRDEGEGCGHGRKTGRALDPCAWLMVQLQHFPGLALDQDRDELPDRSTVVGVMHLVHDPLDALSLSIGEPAPQAIGDVKDRPGFVLGDRHAAQSSNHTQTPLGSEVTDIGDRTPTHRASSHVQHDPLRPSERPCRSDVHAGSNALLRTP